METWMWFAGTGVVLGAIIVYVAFMIFLPEWVGITGKTALENERSHREGEAAGVDAGVDAGVGAGEAKNKRSFLERLHDTGRDSKGPPKS